MDISKKVLVSMAWVVAFIGASLLVQALRNVGTTWVDELGFLRVLVLLALLVITFIPLVLAVLVWFGLPKNFYKKLQ